MEKQGFFTIYENGVKVFWSDLGWTFRMLKEQLKHTNNIVEITDHNGYVLWSK